jgi:hypothetical protein
MGEPGASHPKGDTKKEQGKNEALENNTPEK